MNKGGGGGLTAAAAAAGQKQRSLLQRVETDVTYIVDNFTHLVSVARYGKNYRRYCLLYELPFESKCRLKNRLWFRAARMVEAADCLLRLVSVLKQTAIFFGICISKRPC